MESKHNRTMENLESVMEKERDGLEFRGGVYDGGKVGGTRGMWSEALLGSCWEAKEPAG